MTPTEVFEKLEEHVELYERAYTEASLNDDLDTAFINGMYKTIELLKNIIRKEETNNGN